MAIVLGSPLIQVKILFSIQSKFDGDRFTAYICLTESISPYILHDLRLENKTVYIVSDISLIFLIVFF